MISINNLSVSFGGFSLFEQINFHINQSDRVGLVGRNGSGKTTLIKLIAGIALPSSGDISRPSDLTIGYLPQEMDYNKEISVMEETLTAFSHINTIENEIETLNKTISQRDDFESEEYARLLIHLNNLTDRLSVVSSGKREAEAERVLCGLGFKREEFSRERAELSLGWNMRIELAKVLLRRPDILLLDEPTNHLDIESIRWLESYLENYRGAIVLISHDRRFLDSVTSRTVEIVLGKINDYKVSYTKYVELRRERLSQQRAAFENQQKMIEKTEEFIERFRYKATKSNQVQSRIKQLEKIDRIEIEEEDNSALHLRFPPSPRSGNIVLKCRDLSFSYGPKRVFGGVNIVIERGEKIALLGKNGEGKSTFMKLIVGELTPTSGIIEHGHNVKPGYFAQNQDDILDHEITVFETLDRVAVGDIRTKLRDILGAFLFRGEDVDKRVKVLSGGEKSRLAMAKLMLKPLNFLALDEPTNHMDIRSKDILKQSLKSFDGTLVLVSHDRDFLDGLVDKIYEFKDGGVREHLGGLSDFLERKKIESLDEMKQSSIVAEEVTTKNNTSTESYQQKKEREREQKRKKQAIERCEERISLIEEEISKIEQLLSGNHKEVSLHETLKQYQALKSELESMMEEWERLHN